MRTSDFAFDLPPERIAQHPPHIRGSSRLMVLRRGEDRIEHAVIADLHRHVPPGTVVVLNNSRVRKARLYGNAERSGGRVEFLLLRELGDGRWEALVSKAQRQRVGKSYSFPDGVRGRIVGEQGSNRIVRFSRGVDDEYLERFGHVPLPPYIKREDEPEDGERYQTVYAQAVGSVAAPTAGLHLTADILSSLGDVGATVAFVTLHVGLGTFAPVRTAVIEEHQMHEEEYEIDRETAQVVTAAVRDGRGVLAVGTTVVRTLESAWQGGEIRPGRAWTRLYITPGYRFAVVGRLLTNFHTPQSTLLVLVSAFAGRERILAAYREAVEQGYRFFSYGDAMLIL